MKYNEDQQHQIFHPILLIVCKTKKIKINATDVLCQKVFFKYKNYENRA
jgi:hypothetical protein